MEKAYLRKNYEKKLFITLTNISYYCRSRTVFYWAKRWWTYPKEVAVKFGLKDFGVAPAGYNIPNTGHHHLIINADLPDLTLPIPANENYVHFGLGQTEATLTLEPGTYSLQLLMGNYLHIPHEKPLFSEVISITIE